MNLLEKICEHLGVEVGEEWRNNVGDAYKITKKGLFYKWTATEWVECGSLDYNRLLTGELKPVWKPKIGETYYVPEVYGQELYNNWIWEDDECDRDVIKKDIVFKTKEEAIDCANKMLEVAKEGK